MWYSLEPPHGLWYSLEPPRRGGSNEYPQSMFLSRNIKTISEFLSETFQFSVVKFSVYLNRHVFVMSHPEAPYEEEMIGKELQDTTALLQ